MRHLLFAAVTATLAVPVATAQRLTPVASTYPSDPATPPAPLATGVPTLPVPMPNVPTPPPSGPPSSLPQIPARTPPAATQPGTVSAFPPAATASAPPSPAPTTAPAPASPAPAKDAVKFEPYWNNGLFVRSTDKKFVAHVGGVVQYDGAWYSGGRGVQTFPGGVGRFSDGVSPRRLRIMLDGTMYDTMDYKLEIELNNGFSPAGLTAPVSAATVANSVGPTDAWVTFKDVPLVGNVRIGNQKEWFSLEVLESARFLMFMERSYLFDSNQGSAFNNGRSPGVSVFRTWADDLVFTGMGVYKNESDLIGFGLGDGEYAVTGRVGALPVWLPEQQVYGFVGGAMSHRDPVNDAVRVRVRNQVRNAPPALLNLVADTGAVPADSQTLFDLQAAFAAGPFTASGEYQANLINPGRIAGRPDLGTLRYDGFYAQAMYFLTGEHREWDPKVGIFKRVIPLNNLNPKNGTWGAWEVGGRYSFLDLDDQGINGGRLNGVTLGLNWYWNPNTKLQLNYDYLYRDGGSNPLAKGAIHSLGTRLAVDF